MSHLRALHDARDAVAVYPDLAGKVAVITGGSRGIGARTAHAFGANRMRVAVVGRDPHALDSVREELWNHGAEAMAVVADCTRDEATSELAARVAEELGPVDVLATFAGGNGRPRPSIELAADEWRRVLDGDLTATFLTIQAFLPGMLARRTGSIITMSSAAGRQPSQANVAYAAAKAGVVMLTRHLAAELASARIRVNCLAPSAVENDRMRASMTGEQLAELGARFPLGRIGQPGDIAAAATYLASDASGWVTGVTLDIAGGKVI
jgi:NAD(P)-dependent dehydrogenase (short-subunit alcohol dehydrogenase family)